MTNNTFALDALHASTNREIFCPRENTGNPQHDFFAHYSRLSPLQRLSLEQHTVNGTQISRYEPDIEHSTCGVKPSGFVNQLQDKAREMVRGAAFLSLLTFTAPTLAIAAPLRDAVRQLDVTTLETAETLLATDTSAPDYPALINDFASLVGVLPQVEQSLTVDHALEVKIAAPEYAARTLGNSEDAAEFIRCLKLIAGQDASALYLQQLASHYYREARQRLVPEVLKEMGLLALELSAVTATSEQLAFGKTESEEDSQTGANDFPEMSPEERRALWHERAAEMLGEDESDRHERIYADELRAQTRLVYRKGSGFDHDEFAAHLSEMSATTHDDDAFGAYLDSFERAYEQFDEGFAVSLHMSDTDRKIACGDLDDDVDADCLPEAARHMACELHHLYTSGFPLTDRGARNDVEGILVSTFIRDPETRKRIPVPTLAYGIDTWLDAKLTETFGGRVTRSQRRLICVPDRKRPSRTVVCDRVVARAVETKMVKHGEPIRFREIHHSVVRETATVPRLRLHEQIETMEVCPDAEERAETRAVLEILLQHLKRDYHTRGLNESAVYRELTARLASMTDTARVARLKREAWQYREAGRLSFKLFTAFNTHAIARQSELESAPLREMKTHRILYGEGFTVTQTFADGARLFVVAQPVLNRITSLTGKTLGDFARQLQTLPRQEQERVRQAFRERNSQLYMRVCDGLAVEISRASQGRLRYFRWAFYAGNKSEHPIHTLTREDQAAAWEMLKDRSTSGITPSLPFGDSGATNAIITTSPA